MKRFKSYKPSILPGISEVPSHWSAFKLKHIGDLYNGLTGKSGNDFYDEENPNSKPYINFKNIANNVVINPNEYDLVVMSDDDQQNRVQEGDLFFLMSSENFEDIGKTSVLLDDLKDTYLNSFCRGFRIIDKDFDPEFLNYLLLSGYYRQLLSNEAKGFTRINIQVGKIENFLVYAPPTKEEQKNIVSYIKTIEKTINNLIDKKERLIRLLQEKSSSIITETIVRGLNPNVNMKSSNVDWFGDIPEHWHAVAINKIMDVKDGTHDTPAYIDMNTPNSFPLITSKDFQNGAIDFTNAKYISAEDHFEIIKRSNTERGDVLMSMIGGNIGNLMYVDTDRQFSIKNVALFKTSHNKALARFLFYYLKSNLLRTQIDLNSRGGAQGFLGLSDLRKLVFPKVPQSEMEEIVSYLDTVIGRLQYLITTIQLSIEKLKEYRQSIITEAVTGHIALVDWDNQNKKFQYV